jgi:hypothetical protein
MQDKKGIKKIFILFFIIICLFISQISSEQEKSGDHLTLNIFKNSTKFCTRNRTPVSKEMFSSTIEKYIENDIHLKGGYFFFYDQRQKKLLVLKLKKIHNSNIFYMGNHIYFICADFIADDGTVYDLDIFIKNHSDGNLDVIEIHVHKVNGRERNHYLYDEKKNIWRPVVHM